MSKPGITQHQTALERFIRQVDLDGPGGCWVWKGALRGHRYAAFMVKRQTVMVHRWSYETFRGPIPEGKQIDHICANTRCVNPQHLRPMEPYENVRAYWREQRGHCRNGHEMTPENSVWRLKGTVRKCRTCERARQQRWRDKAA